MQWSSTRFTFRPDIYGSSIIQKNLNFEQGLNISSSTSKEDIGVTTFEGVYGNFLNIKTLKEIQKAIQVIWSSLWSDASLLYKKELSLNIENSKISNIGT